MYRPSSGFMLNPSDVVELMLWTIESSTFSISTPYNFTLPQRSLLFTHAPPCFRLRSYILHFHPPAWSFLLHSQVYVWSTFLTRNPSDSTKKKSLCPLFLPLIIIMSHHSPQFSPGKNALLSSDTPTFLLLVNAESIVTEDNPSVTSRV